MDSGYQRRRDTVKRHDHREFDDREPFVLSNDMGTFLELTVKLNSPLGDRTVIDGSTNGILSVAPTPWPPDFSPATEPIP